MASRIKSKITLAVLSAVLLSTNGCFRVGSETAALRDAVLDHTSGNVDKRFELGLGRLSFAVARFGTSFINLPAQARTVIDSIKGGEVSLFKLEGVDPLAQAPEILGASDKAMKSRGWTRMVGVVHDRNLVAVYLPEKLSSVRNIRVSVLVLSEHDLVCVSATSDIRAVMDLAFQKAHQEWAAQ